MALEPVPWYVDGTTPSAGLLRLIGCVAAGGGEGIVSGPDFRVTALDAPAGAVKASIGAAVVPVRTAGFGSQSYLLRALSETQVDVQATDPAAGRSDLVVLRVEDSSVDGSWPIPADILAGPYAFLRVIQGVPPGTRRLDEVRPGDSAITLARLDIPAGTASITQAMVTDLRDLAQPRTARESFLLSGQWATADTVGALTGTWEEFPLGGTFSVRVPRWATHALVEADWSQILTGATEMRGQLRATLGGTSGPTTTVRTTAAGRGSFVTAAKFQIPAAQRGTMQPFALEGIGSAGYTGVLTADINSTVRATVTFSQAPSTE